METADAVTDARVTTEVIHVDGLTYTYPKAPEPAVRGMDFTVGRGEIFGFLGPSGAGKSTTQKVLIGLLRGHGGHASVWGKDPLDWGPDYYQRIGVSFELPNHYQKLGAGEPALLRPLYDVTRWIRWSSSTPSAGRRREHPSRQVLQGNADAAHVRAGADQRSGLLFLDEPTSGLDPVNARKIKNMVLDLKARGAHLSHDARHVDRR
jgi:fluoroquinolone transport system ATP-binding protein